MNRLGVYAAGIALLSAISLPATAVMFHAAPTTGDVQTAAVNVSPAPVDKSPVSSPALSPEGKPIRVISLQASGLQTDTPAPAPTVTRVAAPPAVKPVIQLAEQPVAPEPSKIMSSVPKHVPSARRATRPASGSGKGLVALSSLY